MLVFLIITNYLMIIKALNLPKIKIKTCKLKLKKLIIFSKMSYNPLNLIYKQPQLIIWNKKLLQKSKLSNYTNKNKGVKSLENNYKNNKKMNYNIKKIKQK